MLRLLFLASVILLVSCKKTEVVTTTPVTPTQPPPPPAKTVLKNFTISLKDTGINTATISWTKAGDSSATDIVYSVFLDSVEVGTKIRDTKFSFSQLKYDTKYKVTVKAFNKDNDSIASNYTFTTKDIFLRFFKAILPDINLIEDFTITPDKGYIMTYVSSKDTIFLNSGASSTRTSRILKTDSLGNILWQKKYSYPGREQLLRILSVNQGYVLLASNYVMKINLEGDVIWTRFFSENLKYVFSSFCTTSDNNILLVGTQIKLPSNQNKLSSIVVKVNGSGGNVVWEKSYPVEYDYLSVYDIQEIPNERSYVIYGTQENSKHSLWKIDDTGNMLWQKAFDNGSLRGIMKIVNNQIKIATCVVGGRFINELMLYNLDFNGNLLKKTSIDLPNYSDAVTGFDLTSDGGCVILAIRGVPSSYIPSYISIFKFSATDKKEWGTNYYEFSTPTFGIKQIHDGGYILMPRVPGDQHYIVKMNPSGRY